MLNIGHRHILPLYPLLYILAGAAAWLLRARWAQAAVASCLLWQALDSWSVRPDYLAYFGPQVGGPDQGYRRLVDSSLDWGMDLPELSRWSAAHVAPGSLLYLAYFGTATPEHYGIRCERLPGFFGWYQGGVERLTEGWYAISATRFQGIDRRFFGPWNRLYEEEYQAALASSVQDEDFRRLRFSRLCGWLRSKRPPDAEVGHSFLLWKLTAADLKDALEGPPAEMNDVLLPEAEDTQAVVLLGEKRFAAAALHAARAVRLRPGDGDFHYDLGNAWLALGRTREAEAEFRQALALKPRLTGARLNMAILEAQSARLPEALGEFQTAVALNPSSLQARHDLGLALNALNRKPDAAVEFGAEERLRLRWGPD